MLLLCSRYIFGNVESVKMFTLPNLPLCLSCNIEHEILKNYHAKKRFVALMT